MLPSGIVKDARSPDIEKMASTRSLHVDDPDKPKAIKPWPGIRSLGITKMVGVLIWHDY